MTRRAQGKVRARRHRPMQVRPKTKKCPTCKKVLFRSALDAQLALASIQSKASARRATTEKRAYRCPAGKGWHLTSRQARQRAT